MSETDFTPGDLGFIAVWCDGGPLDGRGYGDMPVFPDGKPGERVSIPLESGEQVTYVRRSQPDRAGRWVYDFAPGAAGLIRVFPNGTSVGGNHPSSTPVRSVAERARPDHPGTAMTLTTPFTPNAPQTDRAAGAVLGGAAGDALGAGYEFGPPLADTVEVRMAGGGGFGWAPGEWTDDTSMAVPILREVASGADLLADETQARIVAAWMRWAASAKDVGVQTRAVFRAVSGPTASAARVAAEQVHRRTGRSAGNGSLMRTAPVALAYLGDDREADLAAAARAISGLTHFEDDAGDACVLWCLAIRHAVRTGELDATVGLPWLPAERRDRWRDLIAEAESKRPRDFARNGWVVEALQAAWSAIIHGDDLVDVLERAVRGGNDTDTVAAIAGALVGARDGGSAVPFRWARLLHGWPDLRGADLVRLAVRAARGGRDDSAGWPTGDVVDYSGFGDIRPLAAHPNDPGVLLGGVGVLDDLPAEVDAVVSLCRVGAAQVPDRIRPENRHVVHLIDSAKPGENPRLGAVLADAADAVAALRAEGRTVLLHCVQAQSRTPSVAILYAMREFAVPYDEARAAVLGALPAAHPNRAFEAALRAADRRQSSGESR